MINFLGELTLGGAMPAGSAAIAATLPDLEARLAALQNFNPQPGSIAANLSLAQDILQNVQQGIALGLSPPDISAQIAEVLSALNALQANLVVALTFKDALDSGGVYLFHYQGTAGALGSEFAAELSSGLPGAGGAGQATQAVVLAAVAPATWTAFQTVFGL